jgi:hypothetical protein
MVVADDARLMVGIHWYGYGNWEKIRLDPKLGLTTKIAPATLGERETFLPRAPNLDNRASALLQKVPLPNQRFMCGLFLNAHEFVYFWTMFFSCFFVCDYLIYGLLIVEGFYHVLII